MLFSSVVKEQMKSQIQYVEKEWNAAKANHWQAWKKVVNKWKHISMYAVHTKLNTKNIQGIGLKKKKQQKITKHKGGDSSYISQHKDCTFCFFKTQKKI